MFINRFLEKNDVCQWQHEPLKGFVFLRLKDISNVQMVVTNFVYSYTNVHFLKNAHRNLTFYIKILNKEIYVNEYVRIKKRSNFIFKDGIQTFG
jgi:hypothetical protein